MSYDVLRHLEIGPRARKEIKCLIASVFNAYISKTHARAHHPAHTANTHRRTHTGEHTHYLCMVGRSELSKTKTENEIKRERKEDRNIY